MSKKKVIGIDLGTSKCCVGVFRNDKVEILENERGNKTTPSYVAFTDTERLVGEDAKDQAALNPANTVFGVKRIIGREFKDSLVEAAIDKMPYTIMNNPEGETCIHVSYKDVEELLLPQQITAMLLGKMKDLAEGHLKSSVEEAVISVPASFSNAQRQATKDAAAIAGLKVLALINEPTAAAIAYEANRRKTDEENIAIVDFGAGNLDVAIVTIRRGRVCARAVSGSTAIGGNEVDEVLMKHVSGKFEDRYGKMDQLSGGGAMIERLRSSCEKLKRNLTLLPKVQETLDCFGDENILPVTIKREDFNSMIPLEVQSSLQNCLNRASQKSGISLKEIARVVLIGGSSRIPLFQNWLETSFGKKLLDKSVNPDEAVACGAALYAALLSGDNELEELNLKDSFPNNFCFSLQGDSTMQHVFEQHSSKTLPQERKFPFNELSPFNEKTRAHTFELYEELTGQKNPHRLIGTLCLDDEFRQAVSIITDVMFKIDRCGIFNVVVQLKPDHEFPEVVKKCAGKLGKEKLQNAIERERQFRKDDQDEKERVEAMTNLEASCFRLKSEMGDDKVKKIFPELVKKICDKAEENIEWLDATHNVARTECVKKEKTLEKLSDKLKLLLKEYEKKERERALAVRELIDYLTKLEEYKSRTDVSEERELAAELGRQVAETKEWLRSTESQSKDECMEKSKSLKQLHNIIENRLEERRQELERVTAVNNLRDYCTHAENTMANDSNAGDTSGSTKQFIDQVRANICWLDITKDLPTKAECDARKATLKELHAQAVADRAASAEAARVKAMRALQACCNRLTYNLLAAKKVKECDSELVKLLEEEVYIALARLGNRNHISKEECIDKFTALENLEKTVLDSIDEYKRMEENRVATLRTFESEASRIKSTLLNKEAKKVDNDLVCRITQQMNDLNNWLKQRNQFSDFTYEERFSNLKSLIEKLEVKLEVTKKKMLSDKSHNELTSFQNNASVTGGGGPNNRNQGSSNKDETTSYGMPSSTAKGGGGPNNRNQRSSGKEETTSNGMPSSSAAATTLQKRGTPDTQEEGGGGTKKTSWFGWIN